MREFESFECKKPEMHQFALLHRLFIEIGCSNKRCRGRNVASDILWETRLNGQGLKNLTLPFTLNVETSSKKKKRKHFHVNVVNVFLMKVIKQQLKGILSITVEARTQTWRAVKITGVSQC